MKKLGMMLGLVTALLAATPAHADPKDGNPSVKINGCDVTIHAENRNNQTLGYLIRIGAFKGDGRIVEDGTLRPGESLTRHYHGAGFYRIRLGLPADHYYSSDIGSTTCPSPTPTPSPSPSPSPSPTPSTSPTPTPSLTPSPTTTPEPSESPLPPPSTTQSPTPPEGVLSESSSSPPAGDLPNTGSGGFVAALLATALVLTLLGAWGLRYGKGDR